MAQPVLRLYDSLGAEVTAPIALGQAVPGVPTAEQVFTVRNNFGGGASVDTASGVLFRGTARVAGSGSAFVSLGNAFADSRALQVRVIAFSSGATGTTTGFRPSPVLLGTIPDGGQVQIGLRVLATAGAGTSDWELALSIDDSPIVPLMDRLFEVLGNFVYDGQPGGLPDPAFAAVYTRTGGLAPDSPADDSVDVWTEVVYVHAGVWRTYTGTEEVFNATDGDAATLAAGEAYYAGLSLGAAGLTITKGSKDTAPLTGADKPTLPAGEIPAGWVVVPFGLVIDTVEDVLALGFWGLTVVSGLSLEISAGQGAVGGSFARDETPTEFTAADASTLTIWRTPTTGLEVIDSATAPTDLQSMALWDITTAGAAVTAILDRRRIGTERRGGTLYQVSFVVGAPAAGVVTVAVQLEDGIGRPVAAAHVTDFYLSGDAAGLTPSTTAPDGGVAAGTDGAVITADNLSGRLVSEVDGDVDVAVSESTTGTWFLVVVVSGRLYVSGAITPT